eukprot:6240341-Lingulodinium_polyedra.AAC.1
MSTCNFSVWTVTLAICFVEAAGYGSSSPLSVNRTRLGLPDEERGEQIRCFRGGVEEAGASSTN